MITEPILVGLAPLPGNRPSRVKFEYEAGQEIILKGQALTLWWAELARLYMMHQQMSMIDNMPLISSDDVQEDFDDED